MKYKIFLTTTLLALILANSTFAQQTEKINWVSFEESVELWDKEPRPIFIDVYTDWCGWCKRMDATTFVHPAIVKYVNENYYAVKLNAEMTDTVHFDTTVFVNPNPKARRSSHQLAIALLQGKMSYPSYVFLNKDFQKLTVLPGYMQPKKLEPFLKFFGEEIYKEKTWEDFSEQFKSDIE